MAARRRASRPYIPPVHYTATELLDAEIADIETDIRCAERDAQPEYAAECREKLAELLAKRERS